VGGPEALGGFGKGVLRFAEGREGAVAVVPGRSVSLLLIVEDRGGPFEENFGGREVLGKPLPLFVTGKGDMTRKGDSHQIDKAGISW